MSQGNDKDETRLPAQQAHQPQPVAMRDEPQGHASHMDSDSSKDNNKASFQNINEKADEETAGMDKARYDAGIIKLYESVLSEPIPENMLKLIEDLGKQERK